MTTPRKPAENGPIFRAAWEDRLSDPDSRASIERGIAAVRSALSGEEPAVSKDETLEELAERTASMRQAALAAKALENVEETGMLDFDMPEQPSVEPRKWEGRQGGAFGGALSRRIRSANIADTDKATIDQTDFDAVSYETLRHKLVVAKGDQAYSGVLFTSHEFGSLTFSPRMLASRIGSQAVVGTQGRHQDSRVSRINEVVNESLQQRLKKVSDLITSLEADRNAAKLLEDEMKSPGFAHMNVAEMSGLMSHIEGIIHTMVDAIASNQSVDADRLEGVNAALDYRLGDPDYRGAFGYWQEMTNLSGQWTRRKIKIAEKMKKNLEAEIKIRPQA